MHGTRFDHLTRFLANSLSRRQTLTTGIVAAIALVTGQEETAAGPGCKNVNKKCDKKNDCCSNVCKGKKGKKRCKAHDGTTCNAGLRSNFCGGSSVDCTTSTGAQGTCETTTGNAPYCAADTVGVCASCKKDKDCRFLGAKAACVRCAGCTATGGVGCASPAGPPPRG